MQRQEVEEKSRAAVASSTSKLKKGSCPAYFSNLSAKGVTTKSISFVGTSKAQSRFGFSGSSR